MRRQLVSKNPGRITLGCVLVFNILILSLQTNHQPGVAPMRTWLLDVLTPLQKAVDSSVNSIWGLWDGYIALVGVQQQNDQLRAENGALRMELDRRDEQILEAERLRGLMGMKESGIGKSIVARVIGADASHTHHTLTIDKGTRDGVRQNTSILTPDGVVGRVLHASRSSAVVQLITDSQSSIAAMVRSNRVQAVFKGTGAPELELDYIDNDNDIKEGDELITSGLDQIHPKGLPLGVVTFVGPPRALMKAVRIRPSANLNRLEEVMCVIEPAPDGPDGGAEPPAPADPSQVSSG
jgi:rod shape-determining protein MreC